MKLKKIRENLEGLDESLHALYEKQADGKFHLALEDDDAEPLRRAKEHEVGLRQIAERDLGAARQELEGIKAENQRLKADAGKDIAKVREELQSDYAEKERKLKEQHEQETAGLMSSLRESHVEGVAKRIAKDIAINEGAEELLSENIGRRLQVEIIDGKAVTRVLSADGKASSMTPDELQAEYVQNKKFAGIIRANGSSGGGASGGQGGGGASKKLSEMGDAERAEWFKRDPLGFERAVAAEAPR